MLLNDQNLLEQKNVYRDLICLWGIHFQRLDELIVKRVEDGNFCSLCKIEDLNLAIHYYKNFNGMYGTCV